MLSPPRRALASARPAVVRRWSLVGVLAVSLAMPAAALAGSRHATARRSGRRVAIVHVHVRRYGVYRLTATVRRGRHGARTVEVRVGRHVRRVVVRRAGAPVRLVLRVAITRRRFEIRAIGSGRRLRLAVRLRWRGRLSSLLRRPPRSAVTLLAPVRAHPKSAPPAPTVVPTTAPSDAGPSGEAMPVGNIPGWNEIASDDFSEGTLNPADWQIYNNFAPGGDPGGWWSASHVSIVNSELQLSTYSDPGACEFSMGCQSVDDEVSGGLKFLPSQTYGKYLVRMRADDAEGVAMAALLWPTSDSGNGEIDFAEDNGASPRSQITATLWNMSEVPTRDMLNVDMSQWHTVGVEWTPGKVVYTIDGTDWATETDPQVPDIPMQLVLQSQTWDCGATNWETCPDSSTPSVANVDVAWVVEYAPA